MEAEVTMVLPQHKRPPALAGGEGGEARLNIHST